MLLLLFEELLLFWSNDQQNNIPVVWVSSIMIYSLFDKDCF